jgi:hypothetical protein
MIIFSAIGNMGKVYAGETVRVYQYRNGGRRMRRHPPP